MDTGRIGDSITTAPASIGANLPADRYSYLYKQIEASIAHNLDSEGAWKRLDRRELLDQIMLTIRAGMTPKFDTAVINLAVDWLKSNGH